MASLHRLAQEYLITTAPPLTYAGHVPGATFDGDNALDHFRRSVAGAGYVNWDSINVTGAPVESDGSTALGQHRNLLWTDYVGRIEANRS